MEENAEIRKISENDMYEFYYGGTFNEAEEVRIKLQTDYEKSGVVDLDRTYGWIVRVRKQLNK